MLGNRPKVSEVTADHDNAICYLGSVLGGSRHGVSLENSKGNKFDDTRRVVALLLCKLLFKERKQLATMHQFAAC